MPTKSELMNEAEMLGLEVDPTMTKAQVEAVIAAAHSDGTLPPLEEATATPEAVVPRRADPPHPAKVASPEKDPNADFGGRYRLTSRVQIGESTRLPGETLTLTDEDARALLGQKACEPL